MMVSAVAFVFLNKEFDVLAFLRHRDFVRFQRFLAFFDVFKDTFILIAGQFRRNFNERLESKQKLENETKTSLSGKKTFFRQTQKDMDF